MSSHVIWCPKKISVSDSRKRGMWRSQMPSSSPAFPWMLQCFSTWGRPNMEGPGSQQFLLRRNMRPGGQFFCGIRIISGGKWDVEFQTMIAWWRLMASVQKKVWRCFHLGPGSSENHDGNPLRSWPIQTPHSSHPAVHLPFLAFTSDSTFLGGIQVDIHASSHELPTTGIHCITASNASHLPTPRNSSAARWTPSSASRKRISKMWKCDKSHHGPLVSTGESQRHWRVGGLQLAASKKTAQCRSFQFGKLCSTKIQMPEMLFTKSTVVHYSSGDFPLLELGQYQW